MILNRLEFRWSCLDGRAMGQLITELLIAKILIQEGTRIVKGFVLIAEELVE